MSLIALIFVIFPTSLLSQAVAPYICKSYDTCNITCDDQGEGGDLPCNTYGEFNALDGPYFNILCPSYESCKDIIILCPTAYHNETADGRCNITCTANNSCQGITVNANINLHSELNCHGDDNNSNICQDITMNILNNNTMSKQMIRDPSLSSINITCQSYSQWEEEPQMICSSITVNQAITNAKATETASIQNPSTLTLTCASKVYCNDISLNTPNIHFLRLFIAANSLLTESNIMNDNNLNIYLSDSNLTYTNVNMNTANPALRTDVNYTNSVIISLDTNSVINMSSFYIHKVQKVQFTSSDDTSLLMNSYLEISNTKTDVHSLQITDVNTVHNTTINANFVHIFELVCNNKYCGQFQDQQRTLKISNVYTAIFEMNTGAVLTANVNGTDIQNLNISIDRSSFLQNVDIRAENAKSIFVIINGKTLEANTIFAPKASKFRVYCNNARSCANDFKLYMPPKTKNNEHRSFIDCIGYACDKLMIYTTNAVTTDVQFNKTDCPCAHDITDGCFDEWVLHCNNNYAQYSILKNATSCVGEGIHTDVCCGDVVEAIHNKYECPWASNTSYVCIEGTDCNVDCSDIVQQTNRSHFKCSNKEANIDATKALSLTVTCGNSKEDDTCEGLEIYCPIHTGKCTINCDSENSCTEVKINTQKADTVELNCNAIGSCVKTELNNSVSSGDSDINQISVTCNEGGCEEMSFKNIGTARFELHCTKGNITSCSNLIIDAFHSDTFVVNADGIVNNSLFNVSHGNQVEFYVNSVFSNSVIDVNYSNSVSINMTENGYASIQNTVIYAASIENSMELTCFGQSEGKGCVNVSLYATETTTEKELKTRVNCVGNNGCNEMSFYTVNVPSTQDIQFETIDCSCDIMRGKGCSNVLNLFCGNEYNKYSNFSSPFECDGECCGNITQEFQTPQCALYCTPDYVCPINCVGNICNGQTIKAQDSLSLSLSCVINEQNPNVNCNNMIVNCPKNDRCDIQCIGNGICKTLLVNTNSVNSMNLTCGTADSVTTACYNTKLHVSNDLNKHKTVIFGCTKGICQDITISNLTESAVNSNININLYIFGASTIKNLQSKSNSFYDYTIEGNGHLNSSIFNVTNSISIGSSEGDVNTLSISGCTFHAPLSAFNIDSQSQLFKDNTLYGSKYRNSYSFSKDSHIENNNIYIPNTTNDTIKIHLSNNCQFLSNNIHYLFNNNNKDIMLEMNCNDEGIINGLYINGNYLNYQMILGENCKFLNSNISSIQSNLVSIASTKDVIISDMIINGYNTTQILLEFNGKVNDSYINGSNSEDLAVYCGDDTFEKDTKCNNVSIVFPPSDQKRNKTFSALTCYKFGCQRLNLYTVNGADDVNISGVNCECNLDITTACIEQWEIYCTEGEKVPSVFNSATNCTGVCCKNVVEQLHIDQCKWNPSNNETRDDIIYIASATAFILCCVGSLIGAICWRKKRIQRSNDSYLAKYKNFES